MFEGLFQPFHLLVILFVAIAVIPAIFYLLTLRKTLARCARESRTTSPDAVWLLLIPVFNSVYGFILVTDIAKSLANEFARRGIVPEERKPGWELGIAMCVLHIASWIPRRLVFLPSLRSFLWIAVGLSGLVCWILYWMKIADYSGRIVHPFTPEQTPQSLAQHGSLR